MLTPLVSIRRKNLQEKIIHLCWMLHNDCQFHCSYCWPESNKGTQRPALSETLQFIDKVFAFYQKESPSPLLHFSFTGGEPTLWKDFEKLCLTLNEKGAQLGMTTNASSHDLDYWERMAPLFNWVSVSLHPEKSDIENLLPRIEKLCFQTQLSLRIMMPPQEKLWQKGLDFGEKIKISDSIDLFHMEYVPLIDYFHSPKDHFVRMNYNQNQEDFFKHHAVYRRYTPQGLKQRPSFKNLWEFEATNEKGETFDLNLKLRELIAYKQNHFENWDCHIGRELLYIDDHGNIRPSASCRQEGIIGNIRDETIPFYEYPVVCREPYCHCESDIQVTKEKRNVP